MACCSALKRKMAMRVSRSGGWMSAIRPHSKRERRRSSRVRIAIGHFRDPGIYKGFASGGAKDLNKRDEIKFDEKGKKGKKGEVEQSMFTEEQIAEMWMRNIRTSPADFLKMKFAIQTENGKTEK